MVWMISACVLIAMLQSAVTFDQHECGDAPLCFDKPNKYPQQTIDDFLAKHTSLPYLPDYEDEDTQKVNYEVDDDEMNCSTEVRIRKPYTIRHENRLYPVIQSKYFSQSIRDVSCASPDRSCFNAISLSPPFKATCETEQGYIQLYVFDEDKNEVVPLKTQFNCCCKCKIRNTMY